jgi:nucleoside phosphorylase
MRDSVDVQDLRLNYDPEKPQERFVKGGVAGATLTASERLPSQVPWPTKAKPVPAPLPHPPAETADLSAFKGYDAIVVTWTSAEAATLASLLSPGVLVSEWYEYRHDVASYVALVTGDRAPFNDKQPDMARYYRSLGLYFPCRIGSARVLLFKSGLHLDYDGPKTPLKRWVGELVAAVGPKVLITTGTGGGIGTEVKLGDVVVAGHTQFDCTTQFKSEPWAKAKYSTTPVPKNALEKITPALTEPNAARIVSQGARARPKFWSASNDTIVTTDFFGFDDSKDTYKLQGLGQVCDMGDAMVGQAMQAHSEVKWFAIRNASDPQIPNPSNDIKAASKEAGEIYAKCGAFTTAASVIATWAIIDTVCNSSG